MRERSRVAGAGEHRPALRDRIDLAFRVGRPSRAACRRRNRRGDTTRRPSRAASMLRAQPSGLARAAFGERRRRRARAPARRTASARRTGRSASQTLSPLPCCADQVHAVVPVAAAHQRQAVRAEAQAVLDRAHAVLVERRRLVRASRQVVVRLLVGIAPAGLRGRARVSSSTPVSPVRGDVAAGRAAAARGSRRRSACARRGPTADATSAARRLRGTGAPAQRSSCSRSRPRLGMHQRHRVLQLVAEAERAAGLVEAAARPHAAGERLVEQPAVGQHVERRVGRFDLHRAQRAAPVAAAPLSSAARARCRRRGTAAPAAAPRRRRAPTPSVKTISRSWPSASSNGDLHRGARIERRRRRGRTAARGAAPPGCAQRAVAAEELGAVAGHRARRRRRTSKNADAVGEFGVVGVAREQRAARRVDLGHHVHQRSSARRSPSTHSTVAGDARAGARRPERLRDLQHART